MLFYEGYRDIVNVDISPVCVEKMRLRNAEARPDMEFWGNHLSNTTCLMQVFFKSDE